MIDARKDLELLCDKIKNLIKENGYKVEDEIELEVFNMKSEGMGYSGGVVDATLKIRIMKKKEMVG